MRSLVFVTAVALLAFMAKAEEAEKPVDPEAEVIKLDDDNFDDIVFPGGEASPPFIVMFYAPWCPHCTNLKPIFANASINAREDGIKAARFALFDGTTTTTKLKANHNISVRSYPTMYYSLRGKMYKYEAARGITHFIFNSRMLAIQQSRPAGVIDDLSVGSVIDSLDKQGKHSRAAFVFGLPGGQPNTDHLRVVDAVVTVGKARYAFVDFQTKDKTKHIKGTPLDKAIVKASKKEECSGPGGAVLVVDSDAFETPEPFCGEWFEEGDDKKVSADLRAWFTKTAFPAQEMIDGESWPSLAARGMVLVAALKGGFDGTQITALTDKETTTLQTVARALNKVENPVNDIVVGWLDSNAHKEFLESIGVPPSFPTVFVLNPKKEEAFYMDEASAAKLRQSKTGIAGAEATELIVSFAEAVALGQIPTSKYHWYGKIAQLLKSIPPFGYVHTLMGLGDLEFVAITSLIILTPLLLVFAARGGDGDYQPMTKEELARREQLLRQRAAEQKKKQ